MGSIPASKESLQKLYEKMGSNFSIFVPQLCSSVSSFESLVLINELEGEKLNTLNLWKTLLNLHTISLLINLDLSTFLRAEFRTSLNVEKRCNLKYVNVITFEGYNYLFGFGKDKKNAIWQNLKKIAAQINNEGLQSDINNIEQGAKEFEINNATPDDRNNRNLSLHYDSDPKRVYNFLSQISEESETVRVNAFLKIVEEILVFVNKYILKFQIPFYSSTNNYDIDFWEQINHFPDDDSKIFTSLNKSLVTFGNQLDRIVGQCELPKIIIEKLNLDTEAIEQFQPLIKSVRPGLHILFIYLDLASAIRAYLSSDHYFEKQLNLRRINVIVYEGFKHLYGYTDKEHSKSFWQQYISSILKDSTNTILLGSLSKIESELKKLATDEGVNNMHLRERSVHYRYKERDNTIEFFHELVKVNPMIELNNALKLLLILPELMNLNQNSMGVVFDLEHERIKSKNNKTVAQIDAILKILELSSMDTESKQKMIDDTIKIKNRLML